MDVKLQKKKKKTTYMHNLQLCAKNNDDLSLVSVYFEWIGIIMDYLMPKQFL